MRDLTDADKLRLFDFFVSREYRGGNKADVAFIRSLPDDELYTLGRMSLDMISSPRAAEVIHEVLCRFVSDERFPKGRVNDATPD